MIPWSDKRERLLWLALAGLVAVGFAGAVMSDFAYDDYRLIVRNEALTAPGALTAAFRGDYYRSSLDVGGIGYYRPLAVALNVLDRRLWGLNPHGYHLTNVVLHGVAVLLLALWLAHLVDKRSALLAAAIFAVHPTRAESVTFISGRVDVLAGIFYLALLLILSRRGAAGPRTAGAAGPRTAEIVLVAALGAAAMFAKEMAVTLLLVAPLLVYRLPVLGGSRMTLPIPDRPRRPGHESEPRGKGKQRTSAVAPSERVGPARSDRRGAFVTLGAFGLALLIAVGARYWTFGEGTGRGAVPIASWPVRLATTLGEYLLSLIAPSWAINLEPDLKLENWTGQALPGTLLLGAVIILCWWLWRRAPVVSFGLIAGLLAFLPVAQLVPLETEWAERFMYIPSALFAVALAGALSTAPRHGSWHRPLTALVAILICTELLALWHRNRAWRDDESLWNAVTAAGHVSPKVANNRGVNLMERGEMDAAAAAYRQALALDPQMATAHFNLGIIYWSHGELDSALARVGRAVELRPYDIDFLLRFGAIAAQAGRLEESAAIYRRVLAIVPDRVEAWNGLADVERRQGDLTSAQASQARAVTLDPEGLETRFGLAEMHYRTGDAPACLRVCEEILADNPLHGGAHFLRGRIREAQGNIDGALADYRIAAEQDSMSLSARVQLGRLLAAKGMPCEAEAAFAEAVRLAGRRAMPELRAVAEALAAECQKR